MQDQQQPSLLSRLSLILSTPALRWALPTLLFIVLATAALVKPAIEIQNDDDVIKFLPQDDPKVVKFMEIGDRFHGLQMAIVGVEAKGGDIFTLENLMLLRRYAREFKTLECTDLTTGEMTVCVSNTTSFTEIKDISRSVSGRGEEESSITDLVPELPYPSAAEAKDPKIPEILADVKVRALSLDHVRGFLVSPDGSSAAVYAQIDDNRVSVKEAADKIRAKLIEIEKEMGVDVNVFYAGSPFIGSYSADQTREDMMLLAPFVFLIVLLIIVITSRSVWTAAIALFSVAVSIVWVLGLFSLMGGKITLISASLPILLVALGSAYAIHLLSTFLTGLDSGKTRPEAIRNAIIRTGPPIVVCVLTTAAGFFSFLAMDVVPMVVFGASMGVATLLLMLITFWVVTSCCLLFPIPARREGRAPAWALKLMVSGAEGVYKYGRIVALAVGLLAVGAVFMAMQVEPHSDNSSLFAKGSIPVVADDFMNDRFGGSNFLQTEIIGKINHPLVLRQIERMTAYINADPKIAGIQSISDIIVMVGGTMGDGQHIPASSTLSATLAVLAYAEDASVAMMAEDTWQHSLLQIRVRGKNLSEGAEVAMKLQEGIEPLKATRVSIARADLDEKAKKIEHDEMIQHLQWILKKYDKEASYEELHKSLFETEVKVDRNEIRQVIDLNLFDEEDAMVYLDPEKTSIDSLTDEVLQNIVRGTYSEAWLVKHITDLAQASELEDQDGFKAGVAYVHNELGDIAVKKLRKERVSAIFAAVGIEDASEKLNELVESAIWSLSDDVVFLPKAGVTHLASKIIEEESIEVIPSGYPIIYSAMNDSVVHNQIVSLGYSFLMVFICLAFFTRSLLLGLISLIPASMTVLLTFGVMGFFNIGMDVGSSMIAAISLSVGIDYACHLIWKFGRPEKGEAGTEAARNMIRTTGWGIVINALEIGLGLSVLYFGALLPMRNFGVLTGVAMVISAIASLLLLPGLLRVFATRKAKVEKVEASI